MALKVIKDSNWNSLESSIVIKCPKSQEFVINIRHNMDSVRKDELLVFFSN